MLGELQLLCNEAADRNEARINQQIERVKLGLEKGVPPRPPLWTGKPLSLEYIADRMDLDDPLHGYAIRTRREGWLQGFITVTTFTTWQSWFHWDSRIDESGVLAYDFAVDGPALLKHCPPGAPPTTIDHLPLSALKAGSREWKEAEWKLPRLIDIDGSLADALNAQIRDGDPKSEGVIWPHVAEISLLGGLGCGSALLGIILEELEEEDSPYEYVVLQATENSVPFYESHGFIRVGAVARYETKHGPQSDPDYKESTSNAKSVNLPSVWPLPSLPEGCKSVPEVPGVCSPFEWHVVNGGETPRDIAKVYGVSVEDLLFLNRRVHEGIRNYSKLVHGTCIRVPKVPPSPPLDLYREEQGDDTGSPTKEEAKPSTPVVDASTGSSAPQENQSAEQTADGTRNSSTPAPGDAKASCGKKKPTLDLEKTFGLRTATTWDSIPLTCMNNRIGEISSNGCWYKALDDETPRKIAKKLNVPVRALVAVNRHRYEGLSYNSQLKSGTQIRIPGAVPRMSDALPEGYEKSDSSSDPKVRSVRMPERMVESYYNEQEGLTELIQYRHWAFEDDNVVHSCPSYMMARPLRKSKKAKSKWLDVLESCLETRPIESHSYEEIAQGVEKNPPKTMESAAFETAGKRSFNPTDKTKLQGIERNVTDSPSRRSTRVRHVPLIKPRKMKTEVDKLHEEANTEYQREQKILSQPDGGFKCRVMFKSNVLPQSARWANRCEPPLLSYFTKEQKKKLGIYKPRTGRRRSSRRQSSGNQDEENKISHSFTAFRKPLNPFRRIAPVYRGINSDDETESGTSGSSEDESSASIEFVDDETASFPEKNSDTFPTKRVFRFGKGRKRCRPTESDFVKVVLVNAPITGPIPALLPKPLAKQHIQPIPQHPGSPRRRIVNSSEPPKKPKGRGNSFFFFCGVMRKLPEFQGLPMSEINRSLSQRWAALEDKSEYNKLSAADGVRYAKEKEEYLKALHTFQLAGGNVATSKAARTELHKRLINKVVTVKRKPGEAKRAEVVKGAEANPLETALYYFVLTYIPDLQWCRLAPLHQRGVIRHGRYMGRPKWMLIPEGQGKEIDVSASRCDIVHDATALRGVSDADEEEWHIGVKATVLETAPQGKQEENKTHPEAPHANTSNHTNQTLNATLPSLASLPKPN